jgi:uncharacterized protein (TIGR02147 family)
MDIFNYTDYKEFLREALKERRRQVSPTFTYERMAKACGIQKTYLSRVLNSTTTHLSEEQLYLAATYLGLDSEQIEYIVVLRALDKAVNPNYRTLLQKKLESARARRLRSESRLSVDKKEPLSDLSPYYLDPNVMLVHIFLAVEKFRLNLRSLAQQLNISDIYLSDILTKLEHMQLIRLTNDGYVLLQESSHLSVDSPLYGPYRFMQRIKSLERIQKLSREQSYNFSAVFSADTKAYLQIKSRFLEFLENASKLAQKAPDQEIYQMNFDLFDWSK